jgi:foldase protein PrsA
MDNKTIQPETVSSQEHEPKADEKSIQSEPVNVQNQPPKADKKSIKISRKTAIIIVVIIALAVLAYIYKGLFIAVTVNGSPISRLSVIEKLEKQAGKSLLDSLIDEKLVKNEADAKKIIISDDEINGEIKKIEDQVATQGGTIETALAAQGMSMDDLKTQIILRKEMEKLLADKIIVTDQEVAQYIKDNKITVTKGQEAETNDQIKNALSSQKFSSEAQNLITDLKSKAKIQYFVNY